MYEGVLTTTVSHTLMPQRKPKKVIMTQQALNLGISAVAAPANFVGASGGGGKIYF